MATTTLSHSSIGNITGNSEKEDVLQFLGLQYATLANRFAPAVMRDYSGSENIDATNIGPLVPSLAGAEDEQRLIQHTLDYDRSQVRQSETESLVLNITVPKLQGNTPSAESKLPVFAFIHGGGFMVGSAMYPQHDQAKFVQLSVRHGKPCVAVALNYRLGAFGFMASKALQNAGCLPNNGLRDQRTALLWIQKHIAGFGGDPDNVTLMGESAGGVSVSYHLFSKQPLFKRMMLMSGTILLMPPLPLPVAEANYAKSISALGLQDADEKEQLDKLVSGLDVQDILVKTMQAGIPAMPVIDGDLVPSTYTFDSVATGQTDIPGRQWCEAAIIGDCQFDGSIQMLRLGSRKKDIAKAFNASISRTVPAFGAQMLNAYGIRPDLGDEEAFLKVLEVANDANFYTPTLALSQGLESNVKIHMYRFNEPNPWDGMWKGHATHILDISFLFQNFNEFLEAPQKSLAEQFAKDVIAFVNGEAPWGEWKSKAPQAKVFGPQGKMDVVEDVSEKVSRRSVMSDLTKEGGVSLDEAVGAFMAFMRAPPPN